ncbi:MAG: sensor histidine kinase [Flavipsychrobacter sp.]
MQIKYWILIIAVIFHSSVSYAQSNRTSIDSFKQVLTVSSDSDKAMINYLIGKKYLRISGDTSRLYVNEAIAIAQKYNNEKVLSECYAVIGALEKNKGNYDEALNYHLKSLKIKEKTKDPYGLCVTYNDIGIVYKSMKRWREALPFYRRSNEVAKNFNLGSAISFTYNNLGTVYNELGISDSALMSYDSALTYAKKINNTNAIAIALSNIADIQIANKEYNKALSNLKQCLTYDKLNEDKYGISLSNMHLARTYQALGNYKQALAHIDTAYQIAQSEHLNRELIDILSFKSTIEEDAGKMGLALKTSRAAYALKDSIFSEETSKQLSELQTKYETEKKEQQIILQKEQISKKNYVIIGIVVLLLLVLLLGTSYYNRYRLRQQDRLQKAIIHQQELATKAVIEAEEKERKRIAGDLHDGVGQTMSAASMNLSVISNDIPFANEEQRSAFEKARLLVDEGCKEVRTVSHAIMPNALLKSGLGTAIREFLNKIDSHVLKINVYSEGLNERLASNVETVLYRVVQECVNNTIKHAHADTLDISLIKDEDGINITIEDNGNGFDPKKVSSKDGIGLQNLQTRISYLNGTIEWDTAPGKGTVVSIHIP